MQRTCATHPPIAAAKQGVVVTENSLQTTYNDTQQQLTILALDRLLMVAGGMTLLRIAVPVQVLGWKRSVCAGEREVDLLNILLINFNSNIIFTIS